MVHLLDVAVTVHHETVAAKMVLHIEMHDYAATFTLFIFPLIVEAVYKRAVSYTHLDVYKRQVESGFHVGGAIPVTLHCRVAATQAYGLQDMQI